MCDSNVNIKLYRNNKCISYYIKIIQTHLKLHKNIQYEL